MNNIIHFDFFLLFLTVSSSLYGVYYGKELTVSFFFSSDKEPADEVFAKDFSFFIVDRLCSTAAFFSACNFYFALAAAWTNIWSNSTGDGTGMKFI